MCGLQDQRQAFFKLVEMGLEMPVIIKRSYGLPVTGYQLPGKSDLQIDESSLTTTTDNRQQTTTIFNYMLQLTSVD